MLNDLMIELQKHAVQEALLLMQSTIATSMALYQAIVYKRLNFYSGMALLVLLLRGQFLVRLPDALGLPALSDTLDSYLWRTPFYMLAVLMVWWGGKKSAAFERELDRAEQLKIVPIAGARKVGAENSNAQISAKAK